MSQFKVVMIIEDFGMLLCKDEARKRREFLEILKRDLAGPGLNTYVQDTKGVQIHVIKIEE